MLTYFPTPYPGEWWYSVLCRYHVRSGRRKFATTKYELYGKRPMTHGRLFPGCDCYTVIKQLPEGILSLERVLLKHTLMPYYLRFYPLEKKQSVLQTLLKGGNGGLTSIQILTPEGKQGLKFCPSCYAEDAKTYGEPYWHREHQIPLISICPKHHCKLRLVEIALARLSEVFLPLGAIPNKEPAAASFEWEKLLADALFSILILPFEAELPEGYSNLENKLRAAGFGIHAIRAKSSLDAEKLRHHGIEFYGSAIGGQYFSKLSPAIVYRICRWKLTSPERYALLSVMAGLTIEELFGDEIQVEDPLLKRLLEYKDSGIAYKKEGLAQLIGVSPHQLDSLSRKYNIPPFWKQCDGNRSEHIRLTLTPEEKQRIADAAALHGNGQTAVFAREVLLGEVEKILKSKSNTSGGREL